MRRHVLLYELGTFAHFGYQLPQTQNPNTIPKLLSLNTNSADSLGLIIGANMLYF